ncbi:MAG: zinc metallopeptidase [Lachnospiraceae bacterium]|nr:zinc metallopeptidase [Lachnospiraceae bacterium]MCI1658015.1 zinc metallopeptidase [Lachnospiraceae bacterium]MCI2196367.1 zinc metallopeptidase [Lachnospiraceae bacterium]
MYGYGMAGFFWDPTYLLIIIGAVICMIASARVRTTYSKYAQFRSNSGMTGAEAAERILQSQGIYDVAVQHVSGELTDHYDPRNRTLSLSDATYGSNSVAAVGVAAHECGHAVQHARNYVPLRIRGAMVPVVNFGATLSWPLIIIGILMSRNLVGHYIINLGIILFSLVVLFQLVTLPVEFNASRRAVRILEEQQILDSEELVYTRRVLKAAAMTYVASAAAAILQLLRILLIAGNRDD